MFKVDLPILTITGTCTGGEGALLALGGNDTGSDVAGSVRCHAHYSGVYSLKRSTRRWAKLGASTSIPDQDGLLLDGSSRG